MESEEIIYQKVYVSSRPPPTISYKDYWTCNLDFDVARSSEDIQRIELKPNTQLSSTGCYWMERRNLGTYQVLIATLLIKRNMITSQIQRVRWNPYADMNPQNVACWHLNILKMIKQVRGDPSRWIKKRNTKLISEYRGLSHSVVKGSRTSPSFKSL